MTGGGHIKGYKLSENAMCQAADALVSLKEQNDGFFVRRGRRQPFACDRQGMPGEAEKTGPASTKKPNMRWWK